MQKQYRQGDWLLIEVEAIPEDATEENRDERGRLIIGEGEATGHAHAVLEKEAQIKVLENMRWLVAGEVVEVIHEEHDTIRLPKGLYELRFQQVYERGEVRQVLD